MSLIPWHFLWRYKVSNLDGVVFSFLLNLTGISGIVTWLAIAVIHLRFRAAYSAQKKSIDDLAYTSPYYPYSTYIAILLGIGILVGQGFAMYIVSNHSILEVAHVYCILLLI